jgi:hypothetical protein
MKRTRSVAKAIEPARRIPTATLPGEEKNEVPVESNLSPERMVQGASTTTAVLSQILAQQEALHQLRDWGINE